MIRLINDISNLSNNNKKAYSHYNLGLTFIKQKKYDSAIKSLSEALKQDNSEKFQSIVRPTLAQAYILNNQLENAFNELIISLSFRNSNDGLYYIYSNIANIYSKVKNYGFAINEYNKALEYRPKEQQIHYSISLIYESLFQIDFAVKEIEKAIEIEKNNSVYLSTYKRLMNSEKIVFNAKRLTILLNTLGLIIVPSFNLKKNKILPMIIYIYPESPLLNLAKVGDYITSIEGFDINNLNSINIEENEDIQITIDNTNFSIKSIEKIKRKLDQNEKMELYYNWFKTFDYRFVEIFDKDNDNLGKQWGYEFESLVKSWLVYENDKYSKYAFYLMLEALYIYKYSNSNTNINYEINLSKIKFNMLNDYLLEFFNNINFFETKKYLENKIRNINNAK
jgi:tetratricopeptide (TPR) repeat protein